MQYVLLVYQGSTPVPAQPDAWAILSPEEQKAAYADYNAINKAPGVTPGLPLGLPQNALLLALFGFNLGVELGQLAIVAAFMPIAFGLRQSWLYRRVALQAGSLLIAAIAMLWLLERALGIAFALT